MNKIRVVYVCHFSDQYIRERISLRGYRVANYIRSLMRAPSFEYNDFGTWNADFIKAFENNDSFSCYVVGHHLGMKRHHQRFLLNGVNYWLFRKRERFLKRGFMFLFKHNSHHQYSKEIFELRTAISEINPDVIVVCGAENPIYSSVILNIKDKPVFVILQTLLNSPKRVEMGIGSKERRNLENAVFRTANYYGTFDIEAVNYIKQMNPRAFCFKLMFPSSLPVLKNRINKQYDFVFFANGLSKNKGIEDALKAFSTVVKHYSSATFVIIGTSVPNYQAHLSRIVSDEHLDDNVYFCGHFPHKDDVFDLVQKAKYAVLPGITASLNSTVREAMLLGLPTILYETDSTSLINNTKTVLLTAKMEDVEDLSMKMLFAYEHPTLMASMAEDAKSYAERFFSTESVGSILCKDISSVINHYRSHSPIPQEDLF